MTACSISSAQKRRRAWKIHPAGVASASPPYPAQRRGESDFLRGERRSYALTTVLARGRDDEENKRASCLGGNYDVTENEHTAVATKCGPRDFAEAEQFSAPARAARCQKR